MKNLLQNVYEELNTDTLFLINGGYSTTSGSPRRTHYGNFSSYANLTGGRSVELDFTDDPNSYELPTSDEIKDAIDTLTGDSNGGTEGGTKKSKNDNENATDLDQLLNKDTKIKDTIDGTDITITASLNYIKNCNKVDLQIIQDTADQNLSYELQYTIIENNNGIITETQASFSQDDTVGAGIGISLDNYENVVGIYANYKVGIENGVYTDSGSLAWKKQD